MCLCLSLRQCCHHPYWLKIDVFSLTIHLVNHFLGKEDLHRLKKVVSDAVMSVDSYAPALPTVDVIEPIGLLFVNDQFPLKKQRGESCHVVRPVRTLLVVVAAAEGEPAPQSLVPKDLNFSQEQATVVVVHFESALVVISLVRVQKAFVIAILYYYLIAVEVTHSVVMDSVLK